MALLFMVLLETVTESNIIIWKKSQNLFEWLIIACVSIELLLIALLNYHNRWCVCVGRLFISSLVLLLMCFHFSSVSIIRSVLPYLHFIFPFGKNWAFQLNCIFVHTIMRNNLKRMNAIHSREKKEKNKCIFRAHDEKKKTSSKNREFSWAYLIICLLTLLHKIGPFNFWLCQWITCGFCYFFGKNKNPTQILFKFKWFYLVALHIEVFNGYFGVCIHV